MNRIILLIIVVSLATSVFATGPVYDVHDFGAVGDGRSNDHDAIQKAIDSCRPGGGTVLLSNGTFLTGQLILNNNIIIRIDSTAKVLGIQSDNDVDYPRGIINTRFPNRMKDDCQRRLFYGDHVRNVTITGGGTICGQGDYAPWMHVAGLGTEKDRPSLLAFVSCTGITVSDIALLRPACWTQVYIESDSITIRNIKVETGSLTPNRDGIDIVDCHNVIIEDCDIRSEDDGICFKSGSEYGCRDIVVRRCYLDKINVTAGNCFKLGTDGLGSFTNFEVSDLTLVNAIQNSAIAIESVDGAIIDNLHFSDCHISNCGQAVFIVLGNRCRTVPGRPVRIGSVSNISFKNIEGKGFTRQYPSVITGISGHNIQNVTFENCTLQLMGGIKTTDQKVPEYDASYPEGSKYGETNAFAFYIRHADKVTFVNCKISSAEPDARDWKSTDDVKELIVK
jgi:polygalacturonase